MTNSVLYYKYESAHLDSVSGSEVNTMRQVQEIILEECGNNIGLFGVYLSTQNFDSIETQLKLKIIIFKAMKTQGT